MRAMPKTLDTQGFSGLREEVVRSEGRPSCSPVLQALIFIRTYQNPETFWFPDFFLSDARCPWSWFQKSYPSAENYSSDDSRVEVKLAKVNIKAHQ